jgi:hypothetical protein
MPPPAVGAARVLELLDDALVERADPREHGGDVGEDAKAEARDRGFAASVVRGAAGDEGDAAVLDADALRVAERRGAGGRRQLGERGPSETRASAARARPR